MVYKSTAVVLGALALNAASTMATPIAAPATPDGMVTKSQAKILNARMAADAANTLEAREPMVMQPPVYKDGHWVQAPAPHRRPGMPALPGPAQPAMGALKREPSDHDSEALEARRVSAHRVLGQAANYAPLAAAGLSFLPVGQSQRREVEDLEARRVSAGRVLDHAANLAPLAAVGLSFLPAGQPQRRDYEEVLGRELSDVEARSLDEFVQHFQEVAPYLPMLVPEPSESSKPKPRPTGGKKPKRELSDEEIHDLEARRVSAGRILGQAADFAPLAAAGLSFLPVGQPQRRDVEDLEARRVSAGRILDHASNLAPLAAAGLSFLPVGQPQRRDVEDLEVRRVSAGRVLDHAANISPLAAVGLGFLPTGQSQRRDVEDLEARRVSAGRILGQAADFAPLAAAGLSFLPGQPERREVEDLEVRRVSAGRVLGHAADLAPLAAVGLSFIPTGQPQRRDIEDILGRELTDIEARALADVWSGKLDGEHDLD